MGPAEVAYRSWQEASRSFARIAHDAKQAPRQTGELPFPKT